MNVSEYMRKHGLTDADIDAMAAPYESGDYPSGGGEVFTGSHLDVVGKRRVTKSAAQAPSFRHGVKPRIAVR